MARKKRDYKQEYASRKARADAKGLSRSQARGHPKPHEKPLRGPKVNQRYERILERGVRELRQGKSLGSSAKAAGVSTERLRNYASQTGVVSKKGSRWVVSGDQRERVLPILSEGELKAIHVQGYTRSKTLGAYWNAVSQFTQTNNRKLLKEWEGRGLLDVKGKRHQYETNPNVVHRLTATHDEPFENIYRIVI